MVGSATPTDPVIDQTDTYVVTQVETTSEVTMYSDVALYDPLTDRMTTELVLRPVVQNHYIESGYTTSGEIVISQYALDRAGDPTIELVDEARIVRGVGANHTIYDAGEQVIPVSFPSEVGELESPMAAVAATGGQITEGVLLDEAVFVEALQMGVDARVEVAGAPGRLERISNGRFRVVSSFADLATMTGSAVSSASGTPPYGNGTGSLTRTYKPKRDEDGRTVYVLEEAIFESDERQGNGRVRARERMRFKDVRWKRNKIKDRGRRDRRGQGISAYETQGDFSPLASVITEPCSPTAIQCEEETPTPTPPTDSCIGKPLQNVVFQHGIISSASGAWGSETDQTKTRGFLSSRFCFGSVVAPSQPFGGVIPGHLEQANNLKSQMRGTGKNQFVLITHSQGGLVGRHTAQQLVEEGQGNLVEGVITIGTPHQGAYFAMLARNTVYDTAIAPGAGSAICGQRSTSAACRLFAPIVANAAFNYVLGNVFPTAQDNQPSSPLIAKLNRTSEATFLRYGIQHYPPKRWMMPRLFGDLTRGPHGFWNGRTWVTGTEWTYKGLRVGSIAFLFVGWGGASSFCRNAANVMDNIDRWYDRVTEPGMDSDGIIQGPSQIYPRANEQYRLAGSRAVSHLGSTQSNETREVLINILDRNFRVERRR